MRRVIHLGVTIAIAASASGAHAAGDAVKGKAVFNQCMACHKVSATPTPGVGPSLYKVVGRPPASQKGFAYSPAMTKFGGVWTILRLDAYLAAPMKVVPGGRMPFAGLKDPSDRANVIAYIMSQSK